MKLSGGDVRTAAGVGHGGHVRVAQLDEGGSDARVALLAVAQQRPNVFQRLVIPRARRAAQVAERLAEPR